MYENEDLNEDGNQCMRICISTRVMHLMLDGAYEYESAPGIMTLCDT